MIIFRLGKCNYRSTHAWLYRVLLFIILILLTVYGNYRFRLYLLKIREQEHKLGRTNTPGNIKENRVSNKSQNIDDREFRTIKKTERIKNKVDGNKEENKKNVGEKRKCIQQTIIMNLYNSCFRLTS